MFCPKCGAADQTSESYCRSCGWWLVDPEPGQSIGIFRKSTREQKIRKMRILGLIGIALSLTSAGIIWAFLSGPIDRGTLFIALMCSLIVAVYQAVTMYLGYRVTSTPPRRDGLNEGTRESVAQGELREPAPSHLNAPASVTDGTTELLDPALVPRGRREK